MHATTISAMRTRAWFRLGAVGAVLGLAIGAMTVIPAKVAGAATGNTYYVNSATDTPFTTLADLSGPALDCTSPTNTGCGIDDAIEFFNSDTTSNNADTVVFSASVSTFTVGQHTAINNFTSGITLAIDGNGATQTAVSGNHSVRVFEVDSGVVGISGLTIENGIGFIGGGILNGGTITLTDSTVSGNAAEFGLGGGILNGGTATITDSTISGNTAVDGGGIINGGFRGFNGGTMTLTDSTVSGNTASDNGGGIFNGGTATITDSTISGNTAENFGGGIGNAGTASVGATIVAGNTGGVAPNCTGSPLTSVGYNLTNDAGTQCGFTQSTDVVNTDPLLGALGGNGGPTQTMLPAPTSSAVGVIPPGTTLNSVPVCPRTDQRGVASTSGAKCTIGAVEVPACASGLTAHVLTATYHTGTFSGLFCVSAKGVGTYSQGAVSGFGAVIRVKATTIIGAVGKNLFLLGAINGTTSSFGELAPTPSHGTFTLS